MRQFQGGRASGRKDHRQYDESLQKETKKGDARGRDLINEHRRLLQQ